MKINNGVQLDDTLSLVKRICQDHGMWYTNASDLKKGEEIGDKLVYKNFNDLGFDKVLFHQHNSTDIKTIIGEKILMVQMIYKQKLPFFLRSLS